MRKGFTLLELLLVTAIISILAGFTYPLARKSIKAAEFRTFTDKVYLFLDYAKTQAIIKNTVLEVEFDLEENKIFLVKNGEDTGNVLSQIQLPVKISLRPEGEKIIFYPDGTIDKFEVNISHDTRSTVVSSKGFDGKIKCVGIGRDLSIIE
ncbi:MAG: prepilin-type N-terminal cleavage/methylation domain-containing protein [Candidatus Omnitrophota bacterium]